MRLLIYNNFTQTQNKNNMTRSHFTSIVCLRFVTYRHVMPQDIGKSTVLRLCRERFMKRGESFGSNLRIEDHHWHVRFIGPRICVITFEQIRLWPADKKKDS